MVRDGAIATTLGEGTPDEVVWKLVEMANDAGGVDNITTIVIEVLD